MFRKSISRAGQDQKNLRGHPLENAPFDFPSAFIRARAYLPWIIVFCIGALLEAVTRVLSLVGWIPGINTPLLSLAASLLMVGGGLVVVRRMRLLTQLLIVAAMLFLFARSMDVTRNVVSLADIPLIGMHSSTGVGVQNLTFSISLMLIIVSFMISALDAQRRREELQQRHDALQQSERRYGSIIQSSMDGFWRLDKTGRILECNDVYCAMTGYSREELLGMHISGLEAKESPEETERHVHKLREAGYDRFETRHRAKDGRVLDIEVSAIALIGSGEPVFYCFLRDITEQKRAEAALRESEKRFRDVALISADWLWEVDLKGRYLYCSERIHEVLGYTAGELLGRTFFDLITAEEEARLRPILLDYIARPRPIHEMETRNLHKDGREVFLVTNAVPVFDASGRLCGYRGADKNITGHKRAQQLTQTRMRLLEYAATHALEEFLPKALDEIGALVESPIGFFHFVEPDQKTLSLQAWSTATTEKFCTALGAGTHYSVDEAGVWADCLRQRRPVTHNDYASLPHRKGMPEGHAAVIRELTVPIFRDGLVVAILGVGNKPRDYLDEDVEIVSYLADVTYEIFQRKRAEEERMRLATAIQQAAESVIITDREGLILYINPAMEKMGGYPSAEVIGKPLEAIHKGESFAAAMQAMHTAIARGETWQGRFENRRNGDESCEVEALISPVRNPSGKVVNYVILERDISKEAALERQLRQSQKLEAVGTLAGGIAHDFRNVLLLVTGHRERALRDLEAGHPAREKIDQVLSAGKRGADLVKQILTFSRKGQQERQAVDMAAAVRDALDLFKVSLPPHVDLRAQIPADCGAVYVDPVHIQQVVINLCKNAQEAMEENGGILEISLQRVRNTEFHAVDAGALQPGPYVLLSVRDTGCGMVEDTRARIFEPFYTTRKSEGTGLGLSTVHGIVLDCGGAITVRSAPRKGTAFDSHFPELQNVPIAPPRPEPTPPSQGTGHLLLLDDDADVVEMTAGLLQDMGYTVHPCTDSREAVVVLLNRRKHIDLIVSDYSMPQLTGMQLARILKDNGLKTPVILITGLSEEITEEGMKENGVVCCITKPFSSAQLVTAIQAILGPSPKETR